MPVAATRNSSATTIPASAGLVRPRSLRQQTRRHKIVPTYARGMTMREVQGFLAEQYGVEVSPEFIGSVTDAVMAEVIAWQGRPLEALYPVVFFDALRLKIREDAVVRNKAVYLASCRPASLAQAIRPIYTAPSAERRGGRGRSRHLRTRPVGAEIPDRRGRLAPGVGQGHSALRLPARGAQGGLHDQRCSCA